MELNVQHPNIDIMKDVTEADLACGEECITLCVNNPQLTVALSTPALNLEGQGGSGDIVVTDNDHRNLTNRDAKDQHPIESITGLREALDNIQVPENVVTEEQFNVVKQEVEYALEQKADVSDLQNVEEELSQKANKSDIPTDYVSEEEFNDIKQEVEYTLEQKADKSDIPTDYISEEEFTFVQQEMVRLLDEKADKSDIPDTSKFLTEHQDISHLATKKELNSKLDESEFDETVNDIKYLFGTKQNVLIAGENITIVDNVISATGGGSVESLEVSEQDNLIKEDNILKAFTEAGSGEITQDFIRTLNVPVEPPTGTWNSYLTDNGVLLLYSNNVIVRTSDGVNFTTNTTRYNVRGMTKANENNTIYCSTPSARLYTSKDDGLTFEDYVTDGLQGMTWLSIEAMNYRTANGWSSMLVMNRSARVLCYTVSTDTWVLNNNNKYTIEFMTTLGHDFWFANKNGQVCKTNTSLIFTYYPTTKVGLTTIKSANGMIFCGFTDGTICHLDLEQWVFHTVAQGETVTDIKYYNGVYYVVTSGANYYTSTDLTTWEKVDLISNYGGSIWFTNFGIVTVNSEANLLPSRKRIENALIDLYNKHDELSEVNQIAYSNSLFTIDYCDAQNYENWLLNGLQQYYDGFKWAKSTILFIATSDGNMYDPITNSDNIEVKKYDVVRIAYDSWGSSAPPSVIGNLQTLVGADNFVSQTEFQGVVNQFDNIIDNLQPKGDYVEMDEVVDYINVSEIDNLTKENDVVKAFTEAGKGAVTTQYARLLNLPQGDWKSLLTDTGILILYKGSVTYRTTDGISFQQVYLPSSPTVLAKNYETNTIYGATPSSAGMWMFSKDDGLTWTYTSEPTLSGYLWDNVIVRNNGSKKTGWNSAMAFTRSNSSSRNFANYSSSANRFEMNNNSKKQINYTTSLNYDYWCANTSGEVFKTSGSSTFTFYIDTKAGLTCIKNCNNNIFCGFSDGTIAELIGYVEGWTYHTVAEGETVTDIKYNNGVYYVVTDNSNYYTSTDLTNWTKFNDVASYGGTLEFTRFGIVQVTEKPVLIPSRQRVENFLLDVQDKTDYEKICGEGLKWEDGQIKLDIVKDIPLRISQGRLNLNNIDKMYFSEEIKMLLISANFSIDFCTADDYDTWLWSNNEDGYWYGEMWASKSVLWICTADGYVYDPLAWGWELYPVKYDVIRIVYDEWGGSCTGEIIGNLAPLKELFNS